MAKRAQNGMLSVFKYPGSKGNLRDRIVQLLPEHRTYCEPFGGSAAVLFAKEPAPIEWYNDVDDILVDFFKVLRKGGEQLETLCRLVDQTPYARSELAFARQHANTDDRLERLRCFLVRSWFTRMGAINDYRTGWKVSLQDSKVVTAWNSVPDRMRAAAERFKRVHVESCDAVDLMMRVDGDRTVFYIDPPYPEETLNFRKAVIYSRQFTDNDHFNLLSALANIKGKAIVSGYRHPMYDHHLRDWIRLDIAHICMSGATKTECLWLNFEPTAQSEAA